MAVQTVTSCPQFVKLMLPSYGAIPNASASSKDSESVFACWKQVVWTQLRPKCRGPPWESTTRKVSDSKFAGCSIGPGRDHAAQTNHCNSRCASLHSAAAGLPLSSRRCSICDSHCSARFAGSNDRRWRARTAGRRPDSRATTSKGRLEYLSTYHGSRESEAGHCTLNRPGSCIVLQERRPTEVDWFSKRDQRSE